MLVLEGLVGFHRTVQLQLLQHYWRRISRHVKNICLLNHWVVSLETKTLTKFLVNYEKKLFVSVVQSCLTFCSPMDCSMPGFPVLHYLPEFTQIHVHWVNDAIQPHLILCCPFLLLPSIFPSISLIQWVGSSHQVVKVLEIQFQHQSFQWIFRFDFL